MSWANDPELQEMFAAELAERSARLAEGAQAILSGDVSEETSSTMLREGHTIKGTARVMGFTAISAAGQLLEKTWREVNDGERTPSKKLALALEDVALALPEAGTADPETGSQALAEAVELLEAVLEMASPAPVQRVDIDEISDGEPPAESEIETDEPANELDDEELDDEELDDEDASAPRVDREEADPPSPAAEQHDAPADATEPPRRLNFGDGPASSSAGPTRTPVTTPELGGLLSAVESWASGQTVNVSAGRLYGIINDAAAMRLELESVMARIREGAPPLELKLSISGLLDTAVSLEEEGLDLASLPVSSLTNALPQLVKYLAKKLDKEIRFEIIGADDIAVDRQILDKIADPVRQLIVNAVRHGIEPQTARKKADKPTTGSITLTTAIKDRSLEIVVSDDGAGIDWDVVRVTAAEMGLYDNSAVDVEELTKALFQPGFSTVVENELGGAGQGLALAAWTVESLFGRIELESTEGSGTTVSLTVPTSQALQRIVLVEAGGMKWGFPEGVVDEILPRAEAEIDESGSTPTLRWGQKTAPLVELGDLVGVSQDEPGSRVVIATHRLGTVAFAVEAAVGMRDVAAKELGALLTGPSPISGAALLGGGDVVLVVDTGELISRVQDPTAEPQPQKVVSAGPYRVLVVDDSQGARVVVSGALASSGFVTTVAASALEALDILHKEHLDALVVDYAMPQEDGVELVERVRTTHPTMPIVMLSGVATPEDQERAMKAGVDVFFDKADFREGALAETLKKLLESR